MGKVICFLFFSLLTGIFFYPFEEKTPSPIPPDPPIDHGQSAIPDPPEPFTINHIRVMRKKGVRVQFPSERESHLLSAKTLPRDLLQVELLKLSGSSIYSVPLWLKRFTNLRYLDLSENNLDADNDLLETLRAMPKLDVLNLSNNPLFKSGSSQDISLAPVWQVLNSLGELYL
ncbi:MAG: leucine-rich repeat domain-containing protein, partial [Candidatus Electrothrix sp. ATG2]|nr:leucine-rich repeat domain-containing protein [Candidatus Electrothrix sp. ATG2]